MSTFVLLVGRFLSLFFFRGPAEAKFWRSWELRARTMLEDEWVVWSRDRTGAYDIQKLRPSNGFD